MKRKILLIFLTIVSVVCLAFGVSACGKNNTGTSSGSESTVSSSDQAAGDGGGVLLTKIRAVRKTAILPKEARAIPMT